LNYKGEVDKWEINILDSPIVLLPVLTYVLMLVIPKIDPKRKSNRWEEVLSIEIYIGFVHVDIGFYYFAYIKINLLQVRI
jgi:hypothetical protein